MCECENNNYYNNRPAGVDEAERTWLDYMADVRAAIGSDIYTNGGLLDRKNHLGYNVACTIGPSNNIMQNLLEREFSYEELSFMSKVRLMSTNKAELERLIKLLEKLKDKMFDPSIYPNLTPSYPWQSSYQYPYFPRPITAPIPSPNLDGNIQPIYGCPAPATPSESFSNLTGFDASKAFDFPKKDKKDGPFTSIKVDDQVKEEEGKIDRINTGLCTIKVDGDPSGLTISKDSSPITENEDKE